MVDEVYTERISFVKESMAVLLGIRTGVGGADLEGGGDFVALGEELGVALDEGC